MSERYLDFHGKKFSVKNCQVVENQKDLIDFFDYLTDFKMTGDESPRFVWRGMKNANMKMFNSAQRYFMKVIGKYTADNYESHVLKLVDYVANWNNFTIERYLESQDIKNDIVAIMTIMQHYGFPTPLLDFSENPFVALYFSSIDENYDRSENNILNYSSLVCLDSNFEAIKNMNIMYGEERHLYYDQMNSMMSKPLLFVSKEHREFRIGTSLNIINQQGMFVFSNSPNLPLEDSIVNICAAEKIKENEVLKCWHIHKRLNQEIRVWLRRNCNISEEFVFPDFYKMIDSFHKS